MVELLAPQLFGGGVSGCADERADLRELDVDFRVGLEELRDAEVEHFDGLFAARGHTDHDVRRLEVAVDDAHVMGFVERTRDLRGEAGGALGRDWPELLDVARQRPAAHVLHDDVEELAGRLAEVEDRDGVGVAQLADDAGFARKSFDPGGLNVCVDREDFDRYGAIDSEV